MDGRTLAGKTALLLSLSLFIGARESGCAPQVCETLRRLGYTLGMGFQIIDDILDFEGSGAEDGALAAELARKPYSPDAIARIVRWIGQCAVLTSEPLIETIGL